MGRDTHGITRRDFMQRAGAAGLAMTGAGCRSVGAGAGERRPNFVYILCDDLGYGDVGCYGSEIIQTPRLDALAAAGLRLTDCYASAPVCSPSRAGVMTGRNPYRCGVADWIPDDSPVHLVREETTVASLLRREGYHTGFVGKWHLSGMLDGRQPTPGDHGFDHWFATQNNARPSHHNPINFVRNGEAVGLLEGYSSALIVDEAIRFLSEQNSEPFALFVWLHSPHEPVATAPEFEALYSDEPDATKRSYYGNVSQLDHEVGRLVDTLDALGLCDDTFLMFTSDNGPETVKRYRGAERSHGSPGPLRGMKLHCYEGGIREPGILRWPGVTRPGTESRVPVSGTDVLPTFCRLAGAPLPDGVALDGTDITPMLFKQPLRRTRPLYWRYDRALGGPKHAMRLENWKVLADAELSRVELYDLDSDLGETSDVAREFPEIAGRTREELQKIAGEVDAEYRVRIKAWA
jgi:arylsulfatase